MKAVSAICLLLLSLTSLHTHAETLFIAVASNFTAPMKVIAREFEQSSPHRIKLSFGASGKFVAQIRHGAPFHLFFSADQAKPFMLEKEGLSVAGSRFTYALGSLVLWSGRKTTPQALIKKLKTGDFNKLALANARLAPYGVAAEQVLTAMHLKQASRTKWVVGENIAQTFQFVHSGNADLGFVALSQLLSTGISVNKHAWSIPSNLYQPVRQDACLLAKGRESKAAQAFLRFIQSEKAQSIIASFGYKTM